MHRLLALIIMMLLSHSIVAAEGGGDGSALLASCKEALKESTNKNFPESANCIGFISAMGKTHDMFVRFKNAQPYYCTPEEVSVGQSIRVVVKYLEEHPEKLHLVDVYLALQALVKAFPCDNQSAQ